MPTNPLAYLFRHSVGSLLQAVRMHRADRINREAIRLWDRGEMANVEQLLRKAMEVCPTHTRTCSNLGTVLCGQQRIEDGMAFLRKAVALDPKYAGARVNLGIALYMSGNSDESVEQYQAALRLDPGNANARLNLLMPLLERCDWDAAEAEVNWFLSRWRETGSATVLDCISPFMSLLVPIPQEIRLRIACHHAMQVSLRVASAPRSQRTDLQGGRRLRIGYLSDGFRDHATAHLATGLFEQHDRSRFEVFAYSFGADDRSEYRRRVVSAFEHFVDVDHVAHHATAQRIASDAIDILVDLNGYTQGCRPEVMALRPAPIQVNYLGFPGSMGADFIDYIIADPIVIPKSDIPNYTERVVWMPASYQVNDQRQRIAATVTPRAAVGLPDGFVFCSFNQHAKIERSVFDTWMKILAGTSGSVLWLLEGAGAKQLCARAQQQGIDPARLIFARKLKKPEHLARLRLADLFLDTHTYNAHTSASDALWAGVPVLTCSGDGFAGRVAASLLIAVGLPELIAADPGAYVEQAIGFARDPEPLRALARRLAANRLDMPLFDTACFTHNLERAYETMWARHLSGAVPQAFAVRLAGVTSAT